MKILINKYQNGGTTNPPFVYYKPVDYNPQPQETAPKEKASTEKTSGGLDDKQLFDMVQNIDGLPSDMEEVIQKLNVFYSRKNLFGTDNKMDTSNLSTQYLQTLLQIKTANFNKEEFTDAKKQALENESLNDVAIGRGETVTVLDSSNKIKFVSVKDFLNSQGDLRAITNADLLQIRSLDSNYANNNDVLGVVKNGIGISKVTKMIQDILNTVNSTEFKKEGYTSSDGQNIIKGAQALKERDVDANGMAIPGTYKYSKSLKSNSQEIKAAVQYIAATLPENAKTLLELHSGNKDNPRQGALDLILQLAAAKTEVHDNEDNSLIAGYDSTGTPVSKTKNGQKDAFDLLKSNQLAAIQSNFGGNRTTYTFQPKDSNASYSIAGTNYGAIKDNTSNKVITDVSYQELLAKSGLSTISDNRSIMFGDYKLPASALKEVMYDNTGLTRVLIPAKTDSYGNKIPDFTYLKRYQQASKEIQNISGNLTDDQKAQKSGQILKKYGLNNLVVNGTPDTRKFGIFLVGDAITTSRVIKNPTNAMDDVSDDDALYDQLQQTLYTNSQGKKTYTLDRDTWTGVLNGYDHVYKAPIYIPISSNTATAYMGNAGATWNQLQGLQQKYDTEDSRTHVNHTDSHNLNK